MNCTDVVECSTEGRGVSTLFGCFGSTTTVSEVAVDCLRFREKTEEEGVVFFEAFVVLVVLLAVLVLVLLVAILGVMCLEVAIIEEFLACLVVVLVVFLTMELDVFCSSLFVEDSP